MQIEDFGSEEIEKLQSQCDSRLSSYRLKFPGMVTEVLVEGKMVESGAQKQQM